MHTLYPGFFLLFQGVRLQWRFVGDKALNLNQPVKDMGPNELKAYAKLGEQQHDEANRELERRPTLRCMIRDHAGLNTGYLQG